MDTYMVVLRIVHILAGVFWVGAAFTTILFLQPTAREIGPAAGPFMAHLAGKKRLVDWVLRAAGLTVLGGPPDVLARVRRTRWRLDRLGARDLAHDRSALRDRRVLDSALSVVRPTIMATLAIGREVAASGGAPTPEQARSSRRSRGGGRRSGKVIVPLLDRRGGRDGRRPLPLEPTLPAESGRGTCRSAPRRRRSPPRADGASRPLPLGPKW